MMQSEHDWLKKYGFHLVNFFNKISNTFRVTGTSERTFYISEIRSFDDRVNIFWDEIKDHYDFIVERDRDYLNWRYCDPRGGDYVVKQAEDNGRVLGYSILRVNKYKKDYPIGYIVDLLTLPGRLDVADALVAEANKYFDSHNINIIKYLLIRNHPYEKILRKYEFVKSPSKIDLFLKPHDKIDAELNKLKKVTLKKLHFVYGDYDAI